MRPASDATKPLELWAYLERERREDEDLLDTSTRVLVGAALVATAGRARRYEEAGRLLGLKGSPNAVRGKMARLVKGR